MLPLENGFPHSTQFPCSSPNWVRVSVAYSLLLLCDTPWCGSPPSVQPAIGSLQLGLLGVKLLRTFLCKFLCEHSCNVCGCSRVPRLGSMASPLLLYFITSCKQNGWTTVHSRQQRKTASVPPTLTSSPVLPLLPTSAAW